MPSNGNSLINAKVVKITVPRIFRTGSGSTAATGWTLRTSYRYLDSISLPSAFDLSPIFLIAATINGFYAPKDKPSSPQRQAENDRHKHEKPTGNLGWPHHGRRDTRSRHARACRGLSGKPTRASRGRVVSPRMEGYGGPAQSSHDRGFAEVQLVQERPLGPAGADDQLTGQRQIPPYKWGHPDAEC